MTGPAARAYDPFATGQWRVAERTFELRDEARARVFPCDVWEPEGDDAPRPLVVYSHPSLFPRRAATFLCRHLASHGYTVAAMDHSEVVAPALGRQQNETPEQRGARMDAMIASRVPDIRALLAHFADAGPVGIVGHSFGGWTALAAPDVEPRIRAVVALAPGGSSQPRPGILPLVLDFRWGREIPTLVIAAEKDVAIPLAGVREVFERIPARAKRMMILRRADHSHFVDNIAQLHESFRTAPMPPELADMQREMLPIAELCSEEEAHRFTRGLTLAHFDAYLRGSTGAAAWLDAEGAHGPNSEP